jgi:hypothetical protein
LQSVFAISEPELAEVGILYPTRHTGEDARLGRTSSGNAYGWLRDPLVLDERLSQFASHTENSVLLSSEFLFDEILSWADGTSTESHIVNLQHIVEKHGFESISVLLFIRNPISHASSLWQQRVKRHGEVRSLAEFIREGSLAHPPLVLRLLVTLDKVPRARVAVRNYSSVSSDLLAPVTEWLGVRRETFSLPSVNNINRSLTFGELELQRQLNMEIGVSGDLLIDRLCEELPDIKADTFPVPHELQRWYWESLESSVKEVNARIAEPHKYRFDQVFGVRDQKDYRFESAQLSVIARSIKGEIGRLTEMVGDHRFEIQRLTELLRDQRLEIERLTDLVGEQRAEITRLENVLTGKTQLCLETGDHSRAARDEAD